jgi:MoxR-like ATPase
MADDDLFAPQSPAVIGGPEPLVPQLAATDPGCANRMLASILMANGTPTLEEVRAVNRHLATLGWPTLTTRDFVQETPEALASRIPDELRAGLLDIAYTLAGDEPIRRRLVDAYAGLWREALEPAATPRTGSPVLRWLIGPVPDHHSTLESKEDLMLEPYRHGQAVHSHVAHAERTPLRQRVERIRAEYRHVLAAVEQVIIGKREVIERVLIAMAARGHVLLVDLPGVGKTQLCKASAAAIETRFGRIQFTPDLLPLDVTGTNVFDVRDKEFRFRPGPIFTHLLLADEINRATPKTQSALLEVMEERCVTVDGVTHRLDEPFQVLATMNPIDHAGTYALPAAQIDRFMMMLELGLPSPDDEVRVLDCHLGPEPPLASVRPVISRAAFIDWRECVPQIHVTPQIKRAAVEAINGLRRGAEDGHSISPRATIAWVRASQARAMLSGREFVTHEDLLEVAPYVLCHRLATDAATVRERLRVIVSQHGGR